MLFTSYEFIAFLAITLLLYYIVPKRAQWPVLLIAGYVFYYLADWHYLFYIATTSLTVWIAGVMIGRLSEQESLYVKEHKAELGRDERKAYKKRMKGRQRMWMLFALLLNLGILAVLKYANFTITNVNAALTFFGSGTELPLVNLILPMGISFYTFQALSYLIDAYRGTVQVERNFFRFALFVSFFPQLVQGPISRYGDLSETLYGPHRFDGHTFAYGLQRILWGYFKKLVIADRILTAVNAIIRDADTYHGAYVLIGMLFYALELYADFTGGIDITIGIAEAMGIRVQENFIRPFFSRSIKEYWRRWHITMGTWFTDYIFYPISVAKPMLKLSKWSRAHLGEQIGKRVPIYLSSFAVWLATGIWHGASWNFVVWGLANWVVIMISQECEPLYEKFHAKFSVGTSRLYRDFQIVRTVLLMSLLRSFDCYRNVPLTFRMWGSMVADFDCSIFTDGSLLGLGLSATDYIVLAVGTLLLLLVSALQRSGSVREKIGSLAYPLRFVIWYGLFLIVLLVGAYGIGYDASQFIYNQF